MSRGNLLAAETQNEGYKTTNWLVPLKELRALAVARYEVPELVALCRAEEKP